MKQEPCRCECGYTCGGPGKCKLFAESAQRCINEHWVHDCDHVWDGPWRDRQNGGTITCSVCGMGADTHNCKVGP